MSLMALIGVTSAIEVQADLIKHQKELLDILDPPGNSPKPDENKTESAKVLAQYRKTTCLGRHSGERFHKMAMTAPRIIPLLFIAVWTFAYVGRFNH